jgi:hypothetical protein
MATFPISPVNDMVDIWSAGLATANPTQAIAQTSPFTIVKSVLSAGPGITLNQNSSSGNVEIVGPGSGEGVQIDEANGIDLNFPGLTTVSTLSPADTLCAFVAAAGHHRAITFQNLSTTLLGQFVTTTALATALQPFATTAQLNAVNTTLTTDIDNIESELSNFVQFSNFTQSFRNSFGWTRLPSGLIIQWTTVGGFGHGPFTITFPIAFPNSIIFGYATDTAGPSGSGAISYAVDTGNATNTSALIWSSTGEGVAPAASWVAGVLLFGF